MGNGASLQTHLITRQGNSQSRLESLLTNHDVVGPNSAKSQKRSGRNSHPFLSLPLNTGRGNDKEKEEEIAEFS